MKPWNTIHALKESKGSNAKQAVLAQVDDDEFWRGGALALDPYKTFGVKKLPTPEVFGQGLVRWDDFSSLADKLSTRGLSGNAARDAILSFASKCTEPQWNWWYRRILERDLDCGVSVETFNKSAPEKFKVIEYAVSLAQPIRKTHIKHMPKRAFIEAKYDGFRANWMVTGNGQPRVFSRNGKEYFNFGAIAAQISRLSTIPGFPSGGVMLDSEVVSESFNAVAAEARKHDGEFEGVAMIFDIVPLDDFYAKRPGAPFEARRAVLEQLIPHLTSVISGERLIHLSHIVGLYDVAAEASKDESGQLVFTEDGHLMRFFEEQVEANLEGVIVKDATAPYSYDRTPAMLKLKPTETFDLKILDSYEGEKKNVGRLGGLVLEGTDPETNELIRTNMGSGFKDHHRVNLWARRDELVGNSIEIRADGVSTNKKGEKSLRFPIFVRLREDK